jgi:hypothetical protein
MVAVPNPPIPFPFNKPHQAPEGCPTQIFFDASDDNTLTRAQLQGFLYHAACDLRAARDALASASQTCAAAVAFTR